MIILDYTRGAVEEKFDKDIKENVLNDFSDSIGVQSLYLQNQAILTLCRKLEDDICELKTRLDSMEVRSKIIL